jgi:hypothetical protein
MLCVTALVLGGIWYSVDPKETYLQEMRETAAIGPHPFLTLKQYGGRFDSCGKVVGIQGSFEFTGVVCCNSSGDCNLDWHMPGAYLGR